MATISITITVAQATRARAAIGAVVNKDGSPATTAQASEWVLKQVRGLVRQYEQRKATSDADTTVDSTLVAEGW